MTLTVKICAFLVLLCLTSVDGFEEFVGKIKSGFEYAGKLLGLNEPQRITNLVSETFGKTSKKMRAEQQQQQQNSTIFSGFLRILGLDTKKISAIAVNAIIFVAQLISTSLSKAPPSELTLAKELNGSPLDWLLKNEKLAELIEYAKDEAIADHVIENVKERSLDEETDCVQLLICKIKPFVWRMQKAIATSAKAGLFDDLPTMEEVADNGDSCEKDHPHCTLRY